MVHTSEQVRKEFAQRLKTAAKQAGYEERGLGALLAKITDSTPKAASKWLSAESIPRPEKMAVIAKKLKVSQQWLQFGEGSEIREPRPNYYSSSNVEAAPSVKESKTAPVISWVQAGEWSEAVDIHQPGYGDSFEPVPDNSGSNVFWLRVMGDSMTAPSGTSVPEGHLILVDPDGDPVNGSLVVAKLVDSQEVTFKKLVIDSGFRYLKPLNPDYKTVQINGNCRIVGVVIEAKIKF